MTFTLVNGSIAKFDNLRADYEKVKHIKLDQKQSMIGMPTMFGGTNVKARNDQISLLEKLKIILQPNLLEVEDIKTPEQMEAHLTASRIFIAANLYVLRQIQNSNSKLQNLIHNFLQISSMNKLEQEDKEICYYATHRTIHSTTTVLPEINAALKTANQKPITEKQWHDFTKFIDSNVKKAKSPNPYENYPIISMTQPFFGMVFSYGGVSIGYLLGRFLSDSANIMSYKYKLTAMIGGVLVLGPVGPTGVALFAPLIAGKLINTFCSVSLAHIMGVAMGIVGQGVGIIAGAPFEVALKLTSKTCSLISDYYSKSGNISNNISGIRLLDGCRMCNGIVIELTQDDSIPEGYAQHTVTVDGEQMYLDGTPMEQVVEDAQLRKQLVTELKDTLSNRQELSKEEGEVSDSEEATECGSEYEYEYVEVSCHSDDEDEEERSLSCSM